MLRMYEIANTLVYYCNSVLIISYLIITPISGIGQYLSGWTSLLKPICLTRHQWVKCIQYNLVLTHSGKATKCTFSGTLVMGCYVYLMDCTYYFTLNMSKYVKYIEHKYDNYELNTIYKLTLGKIFYRKGIPNISYCTLTNEKCAW